MVFAHAHWQGRVATHLAGSNTRMVIINARGVHYEPQASESIIMAHIKDPAKY